MFASIENGHRVAKEGIRFDLSIHAPSVNELSRRRAAQNEARRKSHKKTIQTRNGPKEITVPGRSHWPEADSIRQISGCSLKPPRGTPPSGVPAEEDTHDHSTPVVAPALLPAFPKAVLGLPINFHFADGPNKGSAAANLDPKDVQLYPLLLAQNGMWEKAERMASPVITRPLWIAGKWHPAVIVLANPLQPNFRARVEGKNAAQVGNLSYDLQPNQITDPGLGGLTPMRRQANAIDALIEFLTKEQSWRKL